MKEYDKALETYEAGLKHDPDNSELKEGIARCMEGINKVFPSCNARYCRSLPFLCRHVVGSSDLQLFPSQAHVRVLYSHTLVASVAEDRSALQLS